MSAISGMDILRAAIDRLDKKANRIAVQIQNEFRQFLLEILEEGGKEMVEELELATTKTGWARAARGGFPGRHDTGAMVGEVDYWLSEDEPEVVIGHWGWKNPRSYFILQEHGFDEVEAAGSLQKSYNKMRAKFMAGVRDRAAKMSGGTRGL